ncbi:MAG: HU family DNA-binding protein [Termitinemataceae bacterium]|nr:MAG: HU family DNA-binding protein [Termitinemataceae bacterium]
MTIEKISKADIVDRIYQNTDAGLIKADIKLVVESTFDAIKDALIDGDIVELRGFGTFEIRVRKARPKARNPRTGEIVKCKAHGVAVFRAGSELKDAVWSIKHDRHH